MGGEGCLDYALDSWTCGTFILLNLKPYKISREMWDHLKKVYNQSNSARRIQFDLELSQLSQGNMSIQEFYSSFETLWVEYTDIVYANVLPEGLFDLNVSSIHFDRHRRHGQEDEDLFAAISICTYPKLSKPGMLMPSLPDHECLERKIAESQYHQPT
nr:retrovirus-related Pol polyprotein from transposon TNT 1-94 isoform X1 [Ipomoea batatas]